MPYPFKRFLPAFVSVSILFLLTPGYLAAQNLQSLKLHSVALKVSDVEKSVAFYQDFLGLSTVGRHGDQTILRIGSGRQFMSISQTQSEQAPHISHIGLSAVDFNAQTFMQTLNEAGLSMRASPPTHKDQGLSLADTYWAYDGTVFFADREGVVVQVSDANYCGYSEFNCAQNLQSAQGKLPLLDINHFTTFMANAPTGNQFYQDLFGLGIQSYQGPTTPALAVGDGKQFLMFVGGAAEGPPRNPARIHHVSFAVNKFSVDGIFALLQNNGFNARPDGQSTAGPLSYYVSLRMPNRGGAEGGTPEVYFTDPDGILLQVQDPSYCGGGGYLGEEC